MTDVTYPPLDTPKPVTQDVWIVDSKIDMAAGMLPLPVRMTVIQLEDQSLLLHSPTRHSPDLHRALTALGPIRHLVAPNSAHWTMLKDWQQAVPDATTWAAPGLRRRSQVKRSGVRFDHDLSDGAAGGWPGVIEQIDVEGMGGFHEVALFHRPSRTLVMTDLIQNFEPTKMPAPLRPLLALVGNGAPDGRAPRYLRALVRLRGKSPRDAAARLVGLGPERVIFAHGTWFDQDGTARLERSLDWLLDRKR
jgi:hypothetical protein